MKVKLINENNILDIDLSLIKKASQYVGDKFDSDKKKILNIIFVDRLRMKDLNKKYRDRDTETDVLSFAYEDGDCNFSIGQESIVIGEIIISPEVAFENSRNVDIDGFGFWDFRREIMLLIIHGILHIYSYDHEKKDEKIKMENIQHSLLRDIFSKFDI